MKLLDVPGQYLMCCLLKNDSSFSEMWKLYDSITEELLEFTGRY